MNAYGTADTQIWSLAWFFAFLDRLASALIPGKHGGARIAPRGSNQTRNCVLVLDASGSMQNSDWPPSRLIAAKEAAKAFCKRLKKEQPGASVAIVAYGRSSKIICPLTRASRFNRLASAIDGITCLGTTNMQAGLDDAWRILSNCDADRQVVLLTDGHNTGGCPKSVAAKLRRFAVIESVGIGGRPEDIDASLLKNISSTYPDGTKRYRWIGDKERLIRHFEDLAGGISRS